MVVHVYAIDFADLIAAEIGHTAEPIPEIIGRRSAASVEIESPNPRSGRIGAQIGVTYERIDLRQLLRFGRQSKNSCKSKQRHNESELHGTSAVIRFCSRAREPLIQPPSLRRAQGR